MNRTRLEAPALLLALLGFLVPALGCAGATGRPPVVAVSPPSGPPRPEPAVPAPSPAPAPGLPPVAREPLPGMPPVLDPDDIYSETRPGRLSPVVKDFPERVYVPNSKSNTVDVIDPRTFKIIDHFDVGILPQHVTPSWDLRTLWVLNNIGNTVTRMLPGNPAIERGAGGRSRKLS